MTTLLRVAALASPTLSLVSMVVAFANAVSL